MRHYNTYVGMDVHTKSIVCKGVNIETGEDYSKSFRNEYTLIDDLTTWLKSLPQPLYCAYESGITGYYLAKHLQKNDIDCDIIAITTLKRSTKDKNTKCDKVDAGVILNAITAIKKDYSIVWIPDDETEANRDLNRRYMQVRKKVKIEKQNMVSFLTKHNFIWKEKTKSGNNKKRWTRNYWAWIDSINFEYWQLNKTLKSYIETIKFLENKLDDIEKDIKALATNDKNKAKVAALTQCKGVDLKIAFLIVCEIGDFTRFSSGRKVSMWAGLVPKKKQSSKSDSNQPMTKMGDKYARKALIEGINSIYRWNTSPKINDFSKDCDTQTSQLAYDCNLRIINRYKYFVYDKHKHPNKAKVAVANELIKWLWYIGRNVQVKNL